jgi:hypothetical protein
VSSPRERLYAGAYVALLILVMLYRWPALPESAAEPHTIAASSRHMPDLHYLIHQADSAGLKRSLVLTLAWVESRDNVSPALRGHHCWNAKVHEVNCEIGRFQIKPKTAQARCPGDDIRTYKGNVHCALRMLAEDGGGVRAVQTYIGLGKGAAWRDHYTTTVLAEIGRQEMTP